MRLQAAGQFSVHLDGNHLAGPVVEEDFEHLIVYHDELQLREAI